MAKARAIAAAVVGEAWRSGLCGHRARSRWRWNSGDFVASSSGRSTRCRRAPRRPRRGCASPSCARSASLIEADGQRRDADREQRADLARRRGRGGDQAAPLGRRAFEQIGDDAGIFAADREPHHAAQQEQQPAGRGADLRVGRQQRGRQHRRGHHRDRQQQHVPPAVAVADMAEQHRAQRPHQIGDRETAERRSAATPRRRRRTPATSTVAK